MSFKDKIMSSIKSLQGTKVWFRSVNNHYRIKEGETDDVTKSGKDKSKSK